MAAVIALGAFGSLIGSFLNVVVYRVPRGMSVVRPRSACGSCGHGIRWYDNIPVLSWIVLRARCRDCGARISARYPLVELAGAVFFAVVAIRFVPALLADGAPAHVLAEFTRLLAFLYLAAISLALAIIDVETHRLPNAIVLPAYLVGAVAVAVSCLLTGDASGALRAVVGAIGLGLVYLVLAVVRPGGMGLGDVKLAGALGLMLGWLGWSALAVGAIAGFVLGGLFGVALLLAGRSRTTAIAFGPWMLAGAWIGVLAGPLIARFYLGLFGLG
jgi:leader peptidase (prepilin peptidase)/N-methyltransferase